LPGAEVKIIRPADGEPAEVDEVGELWTRGYHVMAGYFDDPEQTARAVDDEGWLHTGDLASMDERGYCRVEGRLKEMIIRGGENIAPAEIEQVLASHPAVRDAVCFGVPDAKYGELVGAAVTLRADAEPDMRGDRPAYGEVVDEIGHNRVGISVTRERPT